MLVRPTANIIPTIAPDDMSRATELLAFADPDGLGDTLPPDPFTASDLGLAANVIEGEGVLAAAAEGLEDVPEAVPWFTAATPE